MRYLLLLPFFLANINLDAQKVVIFSKTEKCFLNSGNFCNPAGANQIEFLKIFNNQLNRGSSDLAKARLITPPLEWGMKVSDSTYGEITYLPSLKYGFYVNLQLVNLLPDHNYLLCLNGNPKLAGNDLLPDTVPNLNIEKYYDFLSVKTDSHGAFKSTIGIFLKPGDYNLRFYVKDTNGFKIILYHDYFKFSVTQF